MAELLLQYGAHLEHASEPYMKATGTGHPCTVQLFTGRIKIAASLLLSLVMQLVSAGKLPTPLSLACAVGHLAVVELLLLHGANPFHRLKDNSTMIIEAAKSGHTQVVQLLLDYPISILVTPEQAQIPSGMNTTGQIPVASEDSTIFRPSLLP